MGKQGKNRENYLSKDRGHRKQDTKVKQNILFLAFFIVVKKVRFFHQYHC